MCVFVCVSLCVSVCVYTYVSWRSEASGPPGAGVKHGCELSEVSAKNAGPLQERFVLLTTEPSIAPAL